MSDPDTLRDRIARAIDQHPHARAVNRALEVATAERAAALPPADAAAYDDLAEAVRRMRARHDAEVRAAALREAADIVHNVGAALYDDAGLAHAEGAWAVRDRLLTHADTSTEEPTT